MISKSNAALISIAVFTAILVAYIATYKADSNSIVDTSAVNLPFKGTMYNNNKDIKIAPVKLPTYIPAGYHLYDSAYSESIVMLYYIPEWAQDKISKEGETAGRYILAFVAEHCSEPAVKDKVDNGVEYFKEYKSKSDRGDKVQLFEINGNPAMGWESGKKNSITMLDDEIINIEEVEYRAAIAMIDKSGCAYYSVSGYLPLDELKKILESLEEP